MTKKAKTTTLSIIPGTQSVHEAWVTVDKNDHIISVTAGHWGPTPPPEADDLVPGTPVRTWFRSADIKVGRGKRSVSSGHYLSQAEASVAPLDNGFALRLVRMTGPGAQSAHDQTKTPPRNSDPFGVGCGDDS